MKRFYIFGIMLLITTWSCSFPHVAIEGQISAIPVSSNMVRLDFSYTMSSVRVLEIQRSQGGEEPIHITALQPSYSIYLDRDLEPGLEYTYCLVAYVGSRPEILAETTVVPKEIPDNVHYIRPGATGKNDGTDWYNAWTEVPESLERGHTYFFADGTYPRVVFDTPENGTEFIYLKKASEHNHGTDRGWISSYGDGQAIFTENSGIIMAFDYGFYDVDGQTGSGTSGHGFNVKIGTSVATPNYAMMVGDPGNSNPISYFNLYRTEIQLWGCNRIKSGDIENATTIGGRGFQVHSTSSLNHSILSYVYIHDVPGINIYYAGDSFSNIIEYSHIARNHSNPIYHGEAIKIYGNCIDSIVRYSFWEDIEGTAFLSLWDEWEVYGNVFFHTDNYPIGGQNGTWLGMGIVLGYHNTKVYNNTVYNVQGGDGTNAGYYLSGMGNSSYNNLWINCARVRLSKGSNGGDIDTDYNGFYDIADNGGYTGNNIQNFKSNPLGRDFRPVVETAPGKELAFPYNIDADGKIRGEDGIWTRGAFEY